jgi:hypothetical protein
MYAVLWVCSQDDRLPLREIATKFGIRIGMYLFLFFLFFLSLSLFLFRRLFDRASSFLSVTLLH